MTDPELVANLEIQAALLAKSAAEIEHEASQEFDPVRQAQLLAAANTVWANQQLLLAEHAALQGVS